MDESYLPTEKFELIKQLGTGAFGKVILARNIMLNRLEAVKEIHLTKPNLFEKALEEAKRLQKLKHKNIVEVYDAGYLQGERGIYISMEYLRRGSLGNLDFISVLQVKNIFLDVLSAIEYAHSRNYIHRDIKPSNILLQEDGTAKLSDWGIATQLNAHGTATPLGYKNHLAPELFLGERCSISSDIYAVGVTMHRMINGDPSYLQRMNDDQLEKAIMDGKYPSRVDYRLDAPLQLVRLINKALEVNPKNRFSRATEMSNELKNIKIKCEWICVQKETHIEWDGITSNKIVRVLYSRKDGEIVTEQKRKEAKALRRINALCYRDLTPREADRRLSIILRGFGSGRYS